jgi:uncharacterized membrane protein (DUF485 family)
MGMRNDADHAALLARVLKRQSRLGLAVAAVFVVVLVGLPLANMFSPASVEFKVGGFTATWLFLGVLFYIVTAGLAFVFVNASNKIEDETISEYRGNTKS